MPLSSVLVTCLCQVPIRCTVSASTIHWPLMVMGCKVGTWSCQSQITNDMHLKATKHISLQRDLSIALSSLPSHCKFKLLRGRTVGR